MRARQRSLIGLGVLAGLATASGAQTQAVPPVHFAHGGQSQVLQSIFIPPKANAPFTLTLATEWTQPMMGGGTVTTVNVRHIARDSAGHIRQERMTLVPKGGAMQSFMTHIQIGDPQRHVWYQCSTAEKKCGMRDYPLTAEADYTPAAQPSGSLPGGQGTFVHEDLGASSVAGLPVVGTRDTTKINAGVNGNDQPLVTRREFWYSPQLQINLRSIVEHPQLGKQVFTVTEINPSEPDARLFQLPEGYTVVDQRTAK